MNCKLFYSCYLLTVYVTAVLLPAMTQSLQVQHALGLCQSKLLNAKQALLITNYQYKFLCPLPY